ncbi:phosphotransferase enzyme family [Cordyceps militaris]|uniref:Phosphotransferase enzyme family n=1 Tax=Cordyceps militaris TaxID=73501 RepID=A0A2H4SAQ5_CORMI|nr:phosphotransferase enzyme family [Cordyceps militaris]
MGNMGIQAFSITEQQRIEHRAEDTAASPVSGSKSAKRAVVTSGQHSAIEALASRYNDEKPCRVFGPDNGSYNACLFCRVEFPDDATKWVVQMPIELCTVGCQKFRVPHHSGAVGIDAKLLSPHCSSPSAMGQADKRSGHFEVNERFYCASIVRAYGRGESLACDDTAQMFLVSNYIRGRPLEPPMLFQLEQSIRTRLYNQIHDAFLQLRQLEFSTMGSLTHWTGRANQWLAICSPLPTTSSLISGFLDWEFSNIVPLPLFASPSWATDHDDPGLHYLSFDFRTELYRAAIFSATHSELLHEWYPSRNLEPSTAFSIALIVRFTSHVADVFHRRFAKEFGDGLHEAISGFFNANKDYAAEARRRAERNATIKDGE